MGAESASLARNLFCLPFRGRRGDDGRAEREARTLARPASPGRTLSLRADPRGAPPDMLPDHRLRQDIPHLWGIAPLMPRCDRGAARGRPAPSPRRGVNSHAHAARSFPGDGLGTGGIGRAAGLRQASPRGALRRFARTPRAQRRAEADAAGPRGRACFFRPICSAFTPFGSSPLKLRVQAFEPIAARAAAIAAADALRHDPLQAELAGVVEHGRALGRRALR